jgi:hypothetical protein
MVVAMEPEIRTNALRTGRHKGVPLWRRQLLRLRSRFKGRIWSTIAGLAALVGIAVGLVQLGQVVSARPGRAATLSIQLTGVQPTLGDYAVRIDAPFDQFPTTLIPSPDIPGTRVCSPEQHEWLKKYGTPYVDGLRMKLRNTASTGAITVGNFKTVGEVKSPTVPLIAVQCMIPVGQPIYRQYGVLPTDNHSIAVWSDGKRFAATAIQEIRAEGSPVLFDLDPNKSAELELLFDHIEDFTGSIEVSVLAEDKEDVIKLDVPQVLEARGEPDRILVPKFTQTRELKVGIGASSNYPEVKGKPFYVSGMRYSAEELQQRLAALR